MTLPRAAGALAVCALAVAAYLPSARNGFAYDDMPIIALDPRIRDFDLHGIITRGYWQDTTSALYRPLTTLSYAVDWQISDGSPAWFHIVNALWHGAVTVLVLLLLLAIGATLPIALFGAAVFAVHPVHVEAVANTVGRAELMAAAFCLAATLLWTLPARAARRGAGLALLGTFFVLALLSKESAVVLPGLLIVVDVLRGRLRPHRIGSWLRRRLPPLAVCTVIVLLFFAMRTLLPGGITPENLDPSLEVLSAPANRFMTALQAWPHYARLLLFPRVLLADYGPRILMPATFPGPAVILGAVLLTVTVAGGLLAWERGHRIAAGALLWFAVAVLPVSNLIVPIGVLVAERTLYLPSVALSIGLIAVIRPLERRHSGMSTRALIAAGAGIVLGLMLVRTVVRIPDWKDTNTIFVALVRDRPDAFRGAWHFARLDAAHGQHVSAARRYNQALELWPWRRRLVREAAVHANLMGDVARAESLMRFALERWPDELMLRRMQAGVLLDRGDTAAALRHIQIGLTWHPQDSLLLRMRAAALPAGKQ